MNQFLSSSLILTFLLASTTSAAAVKRDGGYSKIHRQAVGPNLRNGVMALDRTMRKYGIQPPQELSDAATQQKNAITSGVAASTNEKVAVGGGTESGSVVANPMLHDQEYLSPVVIGGQTLNLDVDTGSADLWIFNTALPAEDQQGRTVYDIDESKELKGYTFGVNYGDGSQTYGIVARDTVEVGGISVSGQAIELPTAVSHEFTNDTNSDGILGLAFYFANTIKPTKQKTFFENAMASLEAPVFTANLKAGSAGSYEFGYIDNTAYTGTLQYTPLIQSASAVGLWAFEANPGTNASPAIADTGTSLLLLDDDIVRAYWALVPGHTSDPQGITFPCDVELPDFEIKLGDYTATISGSLLNYSAADEAGHCFGGIQSNNGQGINIFGDILFASQFVVFDGGQNRIGFAPHA